MSNPPTRNVGGRPLKHFGKKIKQAHIRLTEDQHVQLSELEKETGINRTELFINRVLAQRNFLITKDVIVQLSEVGAEIGKTGSNINQLARHANTLAKSRQLPSNVINEFNKLFIVFLEQERDINKLFRLMYRTIKGYHDSKDPK